MRRLEFLDYPDGNYIKHMITCDTEDCKMWASSIVPDDMHVRFGGFVEIRVPSSKGPGTVYDYCMLCYIKRYCDTKGNP